MGSRTYPTSNPFPCQATSVPDASDLSLREDIAQQATLETQPIKRTLAILEMYLHHFAEQGRPLALLGDHGSGKTHAIQYARNRLDTLAVREAGSQKRLFQVHVKAEGPDFVTLYREITKGVSLRILRELSERFLADVVAKSLSKHFARHEAERDEGWQGRGAKGPEVFLNRTPRTFRDDDEGQHSSQPVAVVGGPWIGSKQVPHCLRSETLDGMVKCLRHNPSVVSRLFDDYIVGESAVRSNQAAGITSSARGSGDFHRALAFLLDDDLAETAHKWFIGQPLSPADARRLGVSGAISSPDMANSAFHLLSALFHCADWPFVLYVDQIEKLVLEPNNGSLLSDNVGIVRTLVEAIPREHGLLAIAGTERAWIALPEDLRQRFADNVVRFPILTPHEARECISGYLKPGSSDTKGDLWPFDEYSVREILRHAGGNRRRLLQLCATLFDEARTDSSAVDADFARRILGRRAEVKLDEKQISDEIEGLLVLFGLRVRREALSIGSGYSLAVSGMHNVESFLVRIVGAIFDEEDVRKSLSDLTAAVPRSQEAEVALPVLLVVAGYICPQRLGMVARLAGDVLVYRAETFVECLVRWLHRMDALHSARPFAIEAAQPELASFDDCLTDWLASLREQTDYIRIGGIGSLGRMKTASMYPIEQLYTGLRSRDDIGNVEAGRGLNHGRTMLLSEVIPRHGRLLIEGPPGSGKTTFLRYVASILARDELAIPCPGGEAWSTKYLGLKPTGRRRIPVFLRLSQLVAILEEDSNEQKDRRERLLDLLDKTTDAADPQAWRDHWRGLIERGEAMLLLDGLDEVADPKLRNRAFMVFRNAHESWRNCPIVVTSRPFQTEALQEMGFARITIEPFRDQEIREFVERWVKALYGGDIEGHKEAREYRVQLERAILQRPEIRRMARNPVMLTCLAVVHWNEGRLPEGRGRVYRAVIWWLIASRSERRKAGGFHDGFAVRAFARLALTLMGADKGNEKSISFDLQEAAEAVVPVVETDIPAIKDRPSRLQAARDWLRFECLGSGIVEEIAGNQLRFWHLTFQEFLAARQLAFLADGESSNDDWWPIVRKRLDDVQWRETIELLPGCLFDEGGRRRVDLLLVRVLGLRPESSTLADDARIAGIMGRLLVTPEAYDCPPPPAIKERYDEILRLSMAIFTHEGARRVDVMTRIAAAQALGRGGDPRLVRPRDNMIEVQGQGGLSLGKYPVTVEEYQKFVEHGGYVEQRYWDDKGWELRTGENWESPDKWDDQLETPNRPVYVSWYEASAYCRWLTEQWNLTVRLPTAAEWEKAATAKEGEYPWGSAKPSPELANFGGNVGAPTPVGVYPLGDGPYGHCDLAGNIWEWCSDLCVFYLQGRIEHLSVVLGGSWSNEAKEMRRGKQRTQPAGVRVIAGIGFRVLTDVCGSMTGSTQIGHQRRRNPASS